MKISKKLNRVADYLRSDYYKIKEFLEKFHDNTIDSFFKTEIKTALNTLNKFPRLVNLLYWPLKEQTDFLKTNPEACRFIDLEYPYNKLKDQIKFNPELSKMQGNLLAKELTQEVSKVCGIIGNFPEGLPEGFLGGGAFGHVLKEKQGYVRKHLEITERYVKIYSWLIKQDYAFYQEIPFVRVYSANFVKTDQTEKDYLTRKESDLYEGVLILDEVTPFESYSKQLRNRGIARYLKYGDKLVRHYGREDLTDRLIKHTFKTLTRMKSFPIPKSVNWTNFPDGEKRPKKLILYDAHPGNFGVYISDGTKTNPDRLVHTDLDFIEFQY